MASSKNINIKIEDSSESCMRCKEEKSVSTLAVKYCSDCRKWFCQSCLDAHAGFFTNHTLSDKASASTPSPKPCPVHDDEFLKFYCVSCKEFVCPMCRLDDGDHNLHDCISINERVHKIREEVQAAIAELKTKEEKVDERITALNHEWSNVSTRSRELEQRLKKEMQTLEEEHHKLKNETEEELFARKRSITNEIKRLQKLLRDVDATFSLTEAASSNDQLSSPLPEMPNFQEGLHEATLGILLGEDVTHQHKTDVMKLFKRNNIYPEGIYDTAVKIVLCDDPNTDRSYKISELSELKLCHQQVIDTLKFWKIDVDDLTGEESAKLIVRGSRVKRGRDWNSGSEDKNGPGTALEPVRSYKLVTVYWDSGVSGWYYRMGAEGAYDLRLTE